MVGLIPEEYNALTITILLVLRAVQGYVGFLASKGVVEGCRVWFPDHVSLTVGLTNSGYHSGGCTAIVIGGVLYDRFGFTVTLLIAGGMCFVLFLYKLVVLPRDSQPVVVISKEESPDDEKAGYNPNEPPHKKEMSDGAVHSEDIILKNMNIVNEPDVVITEEDDIPTGNTTEETRHTGLSPLIMIPIISYSILETLVGFTSAITTPYLFDEFNVSIAQGGTYIAILYVARFVGAVTSGYIMQKGWATSSLIMASSAILAGIGVVILFPNPSVTFLYNNVIILAYISTFLQGFANQMSTTAALFAFEDVQVKLAKREMSALSKSRSTTIWLCLWTAFNRIGHLVALLAMEYLTYEQGGWMMAGLCLVSLCTSVGVEVAIRKLN